MIELERLMALALGELSGEELDQVELHVLSCTSCAQTLERLLQFGAATRELVMAGKLRSFLLPPLLARIDAAGLITRRYRPVPAQVTLCTATSDDIYVLTELEADLAGVARVDFLFRSSSGEMRINDVPFDAERGLVAYIERGEAYLQLPAMRITLELRAVDGEHERTVAEYTMDHDPGRQ